MEDHLSLKFKTLWGRNVKDVIKELQRLNTLLDVTCKCKFNKIHIQFRNGDSVEEVYSKYFKRLRNE